MMRIAGAAALLAISAGAATVGVDVLSESTPVTPDVPAAFKPSEPPGIGALGRIEPTSRIRRIAPPGGVAMNRVDRLLVQEGDHVKTGQMLAEFADAAAKDAAVSRAEAAVVEARVGLDKIKAGARPSEIESWRARIDSLSALEGIAQRDAARARELVPSGAGARAVAERELAAAQRATADRKQAEAQLVTLVQPRPEDVSLGEARLKTAEAELAKLRADAALTRIFALVDGTILKIYAHPGELVGPEGLFSLADLEHLDVVADVYQTDLPRVRVGAPAEVIVPGDPKRYGATVRDIGWLVERTVEAGADPTAAVDARTTEVHLTLGAAARAAVQHRINMQVQVAISP